MKKYELSKLDFEVLDKALKKIKHNSRNVSDRVRAEYLKDLFAKAHTGYLEIEED